MTAFANRKVSATLTELEWAQVRVAISLRGGELRRAGDDDSAAMCERIYRKLMRTKDAEPPKRKVRRKKNDAQEVLFGDDA